MNDIRRILNGLDPEMAMQAIEELNWMENQIATLQELLKEQLKISGKCCYAKAPSYSKIREKLEALGYKEQITTEILGEDL